MEHAMLPTKHAKRRPLLRPLPAMDLLMMDMQPGSLGVRAGKLISDREAEILRARTVREELKRMEGSLSE